MPSALQPSDFPHSFTLPPEVTIQKSNYRPPTGTTSRRQSVLDGLRFEKIFGRGLHYFTGANSSWTYHFQYALRDSLGTLNIPDHVLVGEDRVLCLETKLTFTTKGLDQLYRYAPLLSSHFKLPVVLIQVAHVLRPGCGSFSIVLSLPEACAQSTEGPHIWHLFRPMVWLESLKPKEDLPVLSSETVIRPRLGRKRRNYR